MKKQIIIIFFVALFLRVGAYVVFDYTGVGGSEQEEYLYNSTDLEVHPELSKKYGYTEWWHRTPTYTMFLYLTNQNIIIQILLSCIAVTLLFKINPIAGLMWCLFPEDIFYSGLYLKGSFMMSIIIIFMYLFRNKKVMYAVPFIVWLFFISYTQGVVEYNLAKATNIFANVAVMWQPMFTVSKQITGFWLMMPNAIICLLIGYIIIRDTIKNKNVFVVGVFVYYTAIWSLGYSPKYKYYMMPIILLIFADAVKNYRRELE